LPEAVSFESRGHGGLLQHGVVALLGFVLTGGEVSDYTAVDQLFALPVAKPKMMLADK
jgi:hypothetical protein